MEDDRGWLEEAARNDWQAAMLELAEILEMKNESPHMEVARMPTTDFTPHLENCWFCDQAARRYDPDGRQRPEQGSIEPPVCRTTWRSLAAATSIRN